MADKRKKALFLDLDGTLLADDKSVPEVNRTAIERMLDAGHSVVIATGRPLSSAVLQAERLGLTSPGCYLIAFNGGVLYDTSAGKVIYKTAIPLEAVERTFREAERRGMHIQTYRGDRVVTVPRFDDRELELYCARILVQKEIIPDIGCLGEDPVKMLIIDLEDRDRLQSFRDWVNEELGSELDTFFSNSEYVEIVPKGLNKGSAILRMAEILGMDREDTVSAGDEANDTAMIKAAGTGCAMANAVEAVKECADYVTVLNNNEGGVAEIIDRFILS